MNVLGETEVWVTVETEKKVACVPFRTVVVLDLPFDLILGKDFNAAARVMVDCSKQAIVISPCVSKGGKKGTELTLTEHINIPGRSHRRVSVTSDSPLDGSYAAFTKAEDYAGKRMFPKHSFTNEEWQNTIRFNDFLARR